jgi:hypothetical protein
MEGSLAPYFRLRCMDKSPERRQGWLGKILLTKHSFAGTTNGEPG